MKLKSMTDFVLEVLNRDYPYNEVKMLTEISNYATFLKQALKLEMFVPCDDEGNVLEYFPIHRFADNPKKYRQYKKAQEKVLFEGFEVENDLLIIPNFGKQDIKNIKGLTIEALTEFEIQLTPTAIKQIQQ